MRSKRDFFAQTFSSLKVRNYRLYFFGQMVSVAGNWMQTIAQSLLVLKLTQSGTDLGIATAIRFLPLLVLSPLGGLWTDRRNKRKLLIKTQFACGVLAAAFAVLVGSGEINLWTIYLLAFLYGLVNVVDNPARNSLIPELVPRSQLGNAIALGSVSNNLSRILGGAVGGTVVAVFGFAWCFGVNAISYIAVLSSIFMMHKSEMFRAERTLKAPGQVREGLRYVRNTPEIALPLLLIAVVGTMTWEYPVTLPLMNEFVFHRGPASYGFMVVCMAIGAIGGAIVVAARSQTTMKSLAGITIAWGILSCLAGLAPNYTVEIIVIVFVGIASLTFSARARTALQLASDPQMRGRVLALWALCWAGSTPVGGVIVGFIGQEAGARWSLIVGGIPTIVGGVLVIPRFLKIDRRLRAESVVEEHDATHIGETIAPDSGSTLTGTS